MRFHRWQPMRNMNRDFEDLRAVQWPAQDAVLKGVPLQKLHNDERLSLPLIHFVNRANIGMIQARCGPGLALKSFQSLMFADQFSGKKLQRHTAAQL